MMIMTGTLIRPSATFSPAGEKGYLPRLSREANLVALPRQSREASLVALPRQSRKTSLVALLPAPRGEKVPEGRMRARSRHSCRMSPGDRR